MCAKVVADRFTDAVICNNPLGECHCPVVYCLQAVALGAAIQAGMYEGSLSDVMVMDVWQAALMRALAKQQLQDEDDDMGDAEADDSVTSDTDEAS